MLIVCVRRSVCVGGVLGVSVCVICSNLEGKEDALHINVLDEDLVSDDHIGRADINLHTLVKTDKPVAYQLVSKNDFKKITGELILKCEAFVGTGAPNPAAPPKPAAAAPAPAAAAPAPAPQQPQVVYQQQPQVVYQQQPRVVMMVRDVLSCVLCPVPRPPLLSRCFSFKI